MFGLENAFYFSSIGLFLIFVGKFMGGDFDVRESIFWIRWFTNSAIFFITMSGYCFLASAGLNAIWHMIRILGGDFMEPVFMMWGGGAFLLALACIILSPLFLFISGQIQKRAGDNI